MPQLIHCNKHVRAIAEDFPKLISNTNPDVSIEYTCTHKYDSILLSNLNFISSVYRTHGRQIWPTKSLKSLICVLLVVLIFNLGGEVVSDVSDLPNVVLEDQRNVRRHGEHYLVCQAGSLGEHGQVPEEVKLHVCCPQIVSSTCSQRWGWVAPASRWWPLSPPSPRCPSVPAWCCPCQCPHLRRTSPLPLCKISPQTH